MTAILLLAIPLVLYLLLNSYFSIGLFRLLMTRRKSPVADSISNGISVVVAARNESGNLPRLLEALCAQHDCATGLELIICDDYSEDNTIDFLDSVSPPFPVRVLRSELLGLPPGKKHALDQGIRQARYEMILITDADTCPGKGWLEAYRATFSDPGCRFAAGLVRYNGPFHGLRGIEALDFYGLVAASAGAAGNGQPFMCNAANMGFLKGSYEDIGGILQARGMSSGDDVMLLHSMIKNYGFHAIRWVVQPDAVVTTTGADSVGAFFKQRVRWASKSKAYNNKMAILTAITVLPANLAITVGVGLYLSGMISMLLPLLLIGMKLMADFPLLRMITHHYEQRKLLWQFLPASLLYPWYTTAIGVLSFFWKPVWKGRVIR